MAHSNTKHREGDTSLTSTGLQQGATSHVVCGGSPEDPRWQSGAREQGSRRRTELPAHPDSPACASRCSGHRTSRSTVRERRQHQHGSGHQGNSQAENPLWCWHTKSWCSQAMGTTRCPAPLPGAEVSLGHGYSPQDGHSPPRTPAGMGTTHTGADLPPQAAAESPVLTPWHFLGEKQTVTATRTKSQGPATQSKSKGKAKHPMSFDGSEEIPHHPSPFRWSSLTMT